MADAGQFLPEPFSDANESAYFFCFYVLLLGAYIHFLSEGSLSGGLLFRLCFLFASVFGGLDQPLFATQMVLPFLF